MKQKLQKPLSKFSPRMLALLVVPLVAFGVYTLFFAKAATTDTASLWMDVDGGSCTYSSSQQLYNSANACADFSTACTNIPTGATVTVLVKAGTYTSNKTSLSNCKPTGKIIFKVATAENASTTSMSVQDTNNVQFEDFYINISNNGNGAGSYFVCTQNITLKNVEIEGDHSQGTSYGDAVQVWPRDDNTKPLCHNQNFTLDRVYIHDLHTYVPAEDNHTDCVQAASSNGLTIVNSRLVNCGTQSFQLNDDAWPCSYTPNCASLSNVKIENSWIGTNGTLGGMTNLTARNNVFINAPNFDANYIKGTKIITGNILDLPQSYHCGVYSGRGVATSVSFSYNIADVDCPAGTNSIKVTNLNTLFVNASTTNADTWDLHLAGNNAAVGAMPYSLAPTTDYDGQARPQTGNVDIGSDQYGTVVTVGQTCTTISQNFGTAGTVTYNFDKAYPCGRFANRGTDGNEGDWWVSPNSGDSGVTITSMTPLSSGGRNGWEVNPSSTSQVAYDSRFTYYSSALMPALPYTATGDKSIVKVISVPAGDSGCAATSDPCLAAASVLTVLANQPPNQGANIFRPAYFGSVKRLFTTDQILSSKLPSLPAVANAPTLAQVATRYQHVQLDDHEGYQSRELHPQTSFFKIKTPTSYSDYGTDLANDNTEAALRLMLNDSTPAKMPALINYVQAGIDWYGIKKGGMDWYADGGHQQGRKLPIAFASVLLNDIDMKSIVRDATNNSFSEDGHVYWSSLANNGKGMALFGNPCNVGDYEYNQTDPNGRGGRTCRDPTGQIDGGQVPGEWYQLCCTTKSYEYISLAVRLMPDIRAVWNYEPLHQSIDRWMDLGTWSNPDPSNRTTGILPSGGRVIASTLHGTNKGGGGYSSDFGDSMWTANRNRIDNWYASYVSGGSAKPGDVNADGSVNITDISALLSAYGQTGSGLPADLDKNGSVNIADLSIILTNYGK